MKYTDLPSPGQIHGGIHLRREAAKAIHAVERAANATGGSNGTSGSYSLGAFFEAAADLAYGVKSGAGGPVLRRVFAISEQKTAVVFEFDRKLDPRKVPATGFVFTPARTLAGATIQGNRLTICLTTNVAAASTVAYTQPGTNNLQSWDGNLLPNFTGVAVAIL